MIQGHLTPGEGGKSWHCQLQPCLLGVPPPDLIASLVLQVKNGHRMYPAGRVLRLTGGGVEDLDSQCAQCEDKWTDGQ